MVTYTKLCSQRNIFHSTSSWRNHVFRMHTRRAIPNACDPLFTLRVVASWKWLPCWYVFRTWICIHPYWTGFFPPHSQLTVAVSSIKKSIWWILCACKTWRTGVASPACRAFSTIGSAERASVYSNPDGSTENLSSLKINIVHYFWVLTFKVW